MRALPVKQRELRPRSMIDAGGVDDDAAEVADDGGGDDVGGVEEGAVDGLAAPLGSTVAGSGSSASWSPRLRARWASQVVSSMTMLTIGSGPSAAGSAAAARSKMAAEGVGAALGGAAFHHRGGGGVAVAGGELGPFGGELGVV